MCQILLSSSIDFRPRWGLLYFWQFGLVTVLPAPEPDQTALKLFGAAVRRERTACSMTQEDLADATGLHPRTIRKIEAGSINVLITTVKRIQKAIGCKWEKLLD